MICALVLAAGESRRMGCNKLLLPYAGTSVIRHVLSTIRDAGVQNVTVVCGNKPEDVQKELQGLGVNFAINPDYKEGMLSSVRCGLTALPDGCEAVLLALGDHPTVETKVIRQLLAARREGAKIAVPKFGERRGHPLLFAVEYRKEILSKYDDLGLRGLLQEHAADVCEVRCENENATLDIDTPEDYNKLISKITGQFQN